MTPNSAFLVGYVLGGLFLLHIQDGETELRHIAILLIPPVFLLGVLLHLLVSSVILLGDAIVGKPEGRAILVKGGRNGCSEGEGSVA